jgi:hypothetical protein
MKDIPGDDERLEILIDLVDMPDPVAALLAGVFLEQALADAITTHFRSGLAPDELELVFSDEKSGPLATFAAKSRAAYALGIFGDLTRRDMRRIRNIRNAFAHPPRHIDFQTPEIKQECNSLEIPTVNGMPSLSGLLATMPKHQYVVAISIYFNSLRVYAPDHRLGGLPEWMTIKLP